MHNLFGNFCHPHNLAATLFSTLLLFLMGSVAGFAESAEFIVRGSPLKKEVALTFDDGPSPYTRKILALLNRYHAKGTFFVLGGHAARYPGLIQALLRHGHEVENHSFSHIRFSEADRLAWERELARTEVELDLLGSPDHDLFRPPYSDYDQHLLNFLGHLNQRLVLWSVDSGDWRGISDLEIATNVLKGIHNGAIVILHDGDENAQADRGSTVAALEIILPALKTRGFQMVTVSKLLAAPEAESE